MHAHAHAHTLQKYNAERWAQQQQSRVAKQLQNGDTPRDIRPTGRTTARGLGNDAQAKEGQRKQPGRTPGISTQDRFYRKGHTEAYSTEWKSPAEQRRRQRQGEGPCFSHHHSGAPGNSTATPAAVALRCTQSQTMRHVRGGEQGGAALLREATYGAPPPTDTARGAVRSEGGGAAHPRGGGAGASAKRPKRRQQASVRGG